MMKGMRLKAPLRKMRKKTTRMGRTGKTLYRTVLSPLRMTSSFSKGSIRDRILHHGDHCSQHSCINPTEPLRLRTWRQNLHRIYNAQEHLHLLALLRGRQQKRRRRKRRILVSQCFLQT